MAFDLTPVLSEFVLFLGGLALLVMGAFSDDEQAGVIGPLAALVLGLAAVLTLAVGTDRVVAFGGHFVSDGYAMYLKLVILLGTAAAILMGRGFMRDEKIDRFEYPVLAIFSALGMALLVSANSLLALYMALELTSLPLYVMAAFNRDNLRSTEAGLKYFVLGALSSGILLYGCSLLYGFTGTIFFDEIASRLSLPPVPGEAPIGVLVGLVFLIAGLAFKMAAVPFHMWTPDVYEGAPSPITGFFAAAPKVAAVGITVRVLMEPFHAWSGQWQQVIVLISICSMFLGSFAAIGQRNIKRLMAYSGIANVGYALLGLAAGTEKGAYGVLVFMSIYLIMTLGTFAAILLLRRQGRYVESIDDLAGLSRSRPGLAAAFAIFMFSLAGVPPLAGFFGKLYVFLAAVDGGLTIVAVIGVIANVIGAYYYLRVVKVIYFDEPAEAFDPTPYKPAAAVAAGMAFLIVAFTIIPAPLLRSAQAAAAALMQ